MKPTNALIRGMLWAIALGPFVVATFVLAPAAHAQGAGSIEVPADADTRALLRQAEARLSAGDAAGAYALLGEQEAALAGNPAYDYLLGVSALDSGRTSDAIFALRRALSIEPGFSGARMELARAYFDAGNYALARPLFVGLRDENPPPGVREVIDSYVRVIDAGPATPAGSFRPFVSIEAGHDSNANGSTAEQQFFGFVLSPQNVETDSPFFGAAAGFQWTVPTGTRQGWFLGARASHRSNPDASFVDATVINGIGAYQWRRGAFFGRIGADAYNAWRDGNSNEAYGGIDVLLGRTVATNWDLALGIRGGAVRFADEIEVLDVNRVLYSLSATWRVGSLTSLRFEAIGGQDSEQQAGSPYGNSKFGGRVSLAAPLGDHVFSASIGQLTTDYDGFFFFQRREDEQFDSLAQIEFRNVLTDGLSLIPRVRYLDNSSDIALYDYDRLEVGLTLSWMAP